MNHKRTNMFGIHTILQTIQKYTLLSSQVNVNCPEFQKKFEVTATYIKDKYKHIKGSSFPLLFK
jgi:hypothetical protein